MSSEESPRRHDQKTDFLAVDDDENKLARSLITNYNFRSLSQPKSPERSILLDRKLFNVEPHTS